MHLNYQPIIDVRTRKVVKAEALCRFPGSPAGLDSPDGFIPYAEKNGLIAGLTSWLLSTAFEFWGRLGNAAPELSLNLSVQNLLESDLVDRTLAAAAANNVKPGRIWIELGERLFDVHDPIAHVAMDRFAKAGIRLCLDGIGPGVTPSTHLQLGEVPVRELKLDSSLTSDFDTDPSQRAEVSRIAGIAKHLAMDLAAKGVERPELIERLALAGCLRVQGNAICPPVDAEAFTAFLQRDAEPVSS